MCVMSSSIKLHLTVDKIPSNGLALTNRVYVSSKTFDILTTKFPDTVCSKYKQDQWSSKTGHYRCTFVTVEKHPFEVEAHPNIQDDQVSLNRLQRKALSIRRGHKVEVEPFENSEGFELGAVLFNVSFISCQSHGQVEIDTDNLARCFLRNHEGQFFKKGQIIIMTSECEKMMLEVKHLVRKGLRIEEPEFFMGRILSHTHISFRVSSNVSVKSIGTKTEEGFLNTLWKKGAPRELLDLTHDTCFNAIRVNEYKPLLASHGIGTDLLKYALEIMAPLKVIQYLVESFPDAFETEEIDTPLHHACSCGSSLEVVKFLIEKSPESFTKKRFLCGNNPLHTACLSEKPPGKGVLEFLFLNYRSSLTEKNSLGWTPLHCACYTRLHIDVVQTLVNKCPEALKIKDKKGSLPLHLACSYSLLHENPILSEIVQILMEKNPSAAKAKNKDKETPLHCACWSNPSLQVVRLLVQKYPHILAVKNCRNQTPLEILDELVSAEQRAIQITGGTNLKENSIKMNGDTLQFLKKLQAAHKWTFR